MCVQFLFWGTKASDKCTQVSNLHGELMLVQAQKHPQARTCTQVPKLRNERACLHPSESLHANSICTQVFRLRDEHAGTAAELLRARHQTSDYERRVRDFEAALALEKRDTQVR